MNKDEEKNRRIVGIVETVNRSEISSIKSTIIQLINIIDDPNSGAKDLMGIIEVDPPLTAKLLKRANSAYYGYSRHISEIREAIVCMGFDEVKELTLSQKVCDMFDSSDYVYGYSRNSLWQHSVAVALFCKFTYRREFRERGENIYVAGLLHDIGLIVLDQFLHHTFVNILKKAKDEQCNVVDIEAEKLGFTHTDIGAAIAENWGFPGEIVTAIRNHHNLTSGDDEFMKVTSTIYLANYICQNKSIGYSDAPNRSTSAFQKCLLRLDVKEIAIKLIIDEVQNEISKMKKAGWF